MNQPTARLAVPLGALLAALTLLSPPARAAPRDADLPALAPRVDRLDLVPPHPLWVPAPRPPLWIAVQLGAADRSSGERAFTAMLLAGIPLERLRASRGRGATPDPGGSLLAAGPAPIAESGAPRLKPALTPRPPDAAPEPPPPDAAAPEPPLPLPVRVTPALARAAVRAALRSARLLDAEARIDALASRARTSALLPQLRLRVSRLVDEAESLSPTEYDPGRTTATGGTSLWLEARATWQLDRLVFAGEEVAIERLRRDRADARAKLATRVLDLLFAWQRAAALEADPELTDEQRRAATLATLEAEASLDLLTDGWLTRYHAARDRGGEAP